MTTIAWDGKVLAADRQITGGSFSRTAIKIWQVGKDKYFGGAGIREECLSVRDWLMDIRKDKPDLSDSFEGILIEGKVAYRIESKLMKDEIKEKHHALGSGAQGAIVLMYMGFGATQAIETTSIFDPYTGCLVDHFKCC